jgi:hypothetical protein
MWFTLVWGYVHQLLRLIYYSSISYIPSLLCTKPQCRALHWTGDLYTEHQILLPKTKSRHKDNFFIEHRALHTHYVAQSNSELLSLSYFTLTSLVFYNTFLHLFILLQFLTKRPKHGRAHGLTPHNSLQKP